MTGQSTHMRRKGFLHGNFFPIQEIPELNEEDATGLYISLIKLYKSHPLVVPMVTYPVNTGVHAAYTTTAHTKQGFIVRPPLGVINHEYFIFCTFLRFNGWSYCGSQASIPATSLCLHEVPETDKGWP